MQNFKRFTGEENHAITSAEAAAFIKQYREHYGTEAAAGVFFDQQAVRALLDQPNAVGLRYYYGENLFGENQLMLVGTGANRNDLLEGEPFKVSMMNPPLTAQGLYDRSAVSHQISAEAAAELTARYQETLQPGQPKGGFFGKQAIQKLLDHPECAGLRFCFGAQKDGKRVIVISCTDKSGAELLHGPMVELSIICPPICGWPNLLNHGVTIESQTIVELAG